MTLACCSEYMCRVCWQVVWCLCVTVFRARFSLLTIALPVALACIAVWSTNRGTLYSLFLPRGYRDGEPDKRRTFRDLFWTAFTSSLVVTLAGAGVAVALTHGPARAPSYPAPLPGCLAAGGADRATDSTSILVWSPWWLLAAVVAAAVVPLVCLVIWQRERTSSAKDTHWSDVPLAGGSVAAGFTTAGLAVVLLGLMRHWLFGANDWILPIRPPFPQGWAGSGAFLLGGFGRSLGWLLGSAGYLDGCDNLLAGQAELILILLVCSGVYGTLVYRTARTSHPRAWSCTAVYLLVCIGAFGVFLGGASFWADRYGLSTLVLIGVVVVAVARVAKTDHFFPLAAPACGPTASPLLPRLEDCFAARIAKVPEYPARARTAIVVTAGGGGIQASAWTAEVLTHLAAEIPSFEQSLCLVSGVSGGSVGAGCFLAGTYPRDDASTACLCPDRTPSSPATAPVETATSDPCPRCKRLRGIRDRARGSLLEQVGLGMAFADLPRLFFGWIPRNRLVDRGWAIERLIDKRLRWWTVRDDGEQPPSRTIRDLCHAVEQGEMPVPLFNAACVQTGQRVIAAPVSFAVNRKTGAGDTPTADAVPHQEQPRHGSRPLFMPEDFSAGEFQANPTLATVIRLSATFGYVSPVARPTREDEARWRNALHMQPARQAADHAERFGLHLCDGGYADNSGVVSAVEACRHLLAAIRRENSGVSKPHSQPSCRILLIRIESFPEESGQPVASASGLSQMLFGPASGLLSARVIAQEERATREIKAFEQDAKADNVPFRAITIRYGSRISRHHPGEREAPAYPPLSWALSQRQQEAIEKEWRFVSTPTQHLVEVFPPTDAQSVATPLAAAIAWPPAPVA